MNDILSRAQGMQQMLPHYYWGWEISWPQELIWTLGCAEMFLYGHLVFENLLHQPTKKKFLLELQPDVFPSGLGEASIPP